MKNKKDQLGKEYDIAIIGGGVVGGMIAYHLAKYRSRIVILEKESDAAMGQSKANSGIVHAGYDPQPGSLKAILNVKGSEMMEGICRDLAVKYRRNGTFVVGYSEEDNENLKILLERGKQNGVRDLALIDGETVRAAEPHLSQRITCALSAPTGAVVCPYELTLHAIGHAMDYGADFLTNFAVSALHCSGEDAGGKATSTAAAAETQAVPGGYRIEAADGRQVWAKIVLNCAGLYSDEIAAMIGDTSFTITPRRGEYQLLDKETGDLVDHTIFRTPTKMGKGVLAVKTVDGNILLGPTSEDIEDKQNTAVTAAGLKTVAAKETEFFDHVPLQMAITQFTGLRAHGDKGDFIINSPRANCGDRVSGTDVSACDRSVGRGTALWCRGLSGRRSAGKSCGTCGSAACTRHAGRTGESGLETTADGNPFVPHTFPRGKKSVDSERAGVRQSHLPLRGGHRRGDPRRDPQESAGEGHRRGEAQNACRDGALSERLLSACGL